jgi:hypothetical protein
LRLDRLEASSLTCLAYSQNMGASSFSLLIGSKLMGSPPERGRRRTRVLGGVTSCVGGCSDLEVGAKGRCTVSEVGAAIIYSALTQGAGLVLVVLVAQL